MTLSDAEIKKRIVDDLYWDARIDASRVLVHVDRGTVTLKGTVPSYTDRNRSTDVACRIPDVIRVDNHLTVRFPPSCKVPDDADIGESIVNSYRSNPDLDRTDISVSVENGTVSLEGSVGELWKKAEAGRIACQARGVCTIVNRIEVIPVKSVADRTIADDVRAAIGRTSRVKIEDVDIRVVNAVVILSGTVPDWTAWRAVIDAAGYSRGVKDVIDDLDIRQSAVSRAVC